MSETGKLRELQVVLQCSLVIVHSTIIVRERERGGGGGGGGADDTVTVNG